MSFPFTALAEERIISFDVTAELREDSSLLITERIHVNIEHKAIKHGIYRVLPMSQNLEKGMYRSHSYNFTSVTLDGEEAPYAKAAHSGNIGVAIGDHKIKAPLGKHIYEIQYSVTNHVLFFDDQDEIYFNVTGNNWKLPIDNISFTFIVPGGVENILETSAATGAFGETGSDFVMEGKNVFRTTRPFAVGEGLTVAISWKKGLASHPNDIRVDWIADNREASFLALFGILALYYLVNKRRLKDKINHPVIPIFYVPKGMSPGYAAALKDRNDTGRFMHADLMGAAVNGFLRVEVQGKKNIVLHRQEPQKKPEVWVRNYCIDLVGCLFSPDDVCDLRTKEGKIRAGITHDLLERIYKKQQREFWQNNLLIKAIGWAIMTTLACAISMVVDYPKIVGVDKINYLIAVFMAYCSTGAGLFFWHAAKKKRRRMLSKIGMAVFAAAPLVAFGIGIMCTQMGGDTFLSGSHLALFFATASCMKRLPNPSRTQKAAKEYAQILGLEMYIKAAEEHRLAMINAPEDTIEKYEEMLPYAIALDCAEAWQKRFDKLLKDVDYEPKWVRDDMLRTRDVVKIITTHTAMSVALAACVAANDSENRSIARSGLGSGGGSSGGSSSSSGGGSGGGGGGGW